MYTFATQISQAITAGGAISAEWVLVGVTILLGSTIAFMFSLLKTFLEQTLKSIKEAILKIERQIELHGEHLDTHDKEIFTVQRDLSNYKREREEQSKEIKEINKTTTEILFKLRAATPQ